jgi:hypothetical protein
MKHKELPWIRAERLTQLRGQQSKLKWRILSLSKVQIRWQSMNAWRTYFSVDDILLKFIISISFLDKLKDASNMRWLQPSSEDGQLAVRILLCCSNGKNKSSQAITGNLNRNWLPRPSAKT